MNKSTIVAQDQNTAYQISEASRLIRFTLWRAATAEEVPEDARKYLADLFIKGDFVGNTCAGYLLHHTAEAPTPPWTQVADLPGGDRA